MSIQALPPRCPDEEKLRPVNWLPPDEAVKDRIPEGMNDDERIRAHLFLGYLEVALRHEFTGQHAEPCGRYKVTAAFNAARDQLATALSLERCNHLLAGMTMNTAGTLMYEDLGHSYTTWGLAGLLPASVLEAVARVRDTLAVTAM